MASSIDCWPVVLDHAGQSTFLVRLIDQRQHQVAELWIAESYRDTEQHQIVIWHLSVGGVVWRAQVNHAVADEQLDVGRLRLDVNVGDFVGWPDNSSASCCLPHQPLNCLP